MPEKIGEGLQYTVFDFGDGSVRKVPKSRDEMIEHCLEWGNNRAEAEENTEKALERREKAVKKLKDGEVDLSIFGDLEFRKNGEVIQEKVRSVDSVFEQANLEEKKEVVDKYVKLLQRLWEEGVGDTIYNFTINTGLDDSGELVMLDFGEIVSSKQRVEKEVRDQKWLDKWSYSKDLEDDRIKEYFKKRMSEEITVEKLEDKWRKSIG